MLAEVAVVEFAIVLAVKSAPSVAAALGYSAAASQALAVARSALVPVQTDLHWRL